VAAHAPAFEELKMSEDDLTPEGLVATIKDLVTLPEVAMRITRMVNDPQSSAEDIAREISNDAALTARLLRVANSPLFGTSGKISSVSRAIAVIGLRQVRDLTVGLTAIRAFDGIPSELVAMESFWRHSMLCAVASGHIAACGDGSHGETPFVAGLLHDIGKLVLYSRVPDAARRALLLSVDSVEDRDLYSCERQIIGFDHGAVGAALAKNWKLPPSLQACIEYHHEPERAKVHLVEVAIVHIANSVAMLAEIGSTDLRDADQISPIALFSVGFDVTRLSAIIRQTQESAADMQRMLVAA
jgi:putative nucleotidyltransferase with HDIG domain